MELLDSASKVAILVASTLVSMHILSGYIRRAKIKRIIQETKQNKSAKKDSNKKEG